LLFHQLVRRLDDVLLCELIVKPTHHEPQESYE
jgi:hypothetical protein